MLDTLDLEYQLSALQQADELQAAIKKQFGENDLRHHLHKKEKKCSQNQTVLSTAGFYPHGILELSLKHKYYPNRITLRAKYKPALISKKKHNKSCLSDMSDYVTAVDGFNYFVNVLNSGLDSFQLPPAIYWNIIRVDYAYQYATPFYELILNILNKGFAMAENLGYKESAYFVNTYRNINIYDKTEQQHLPDIDGEHLLRFEVQCKKDSLKHMAQRHRWDRISLYHVWDEIVAKETVINSVKMLVGKNDFYNLAIAEEMIRMYFQTRKADNIIDFLKKTRHNKAKLKNLLSGKIEGYSEDYIRRSILPALNKIGIAPVLVPDCYHISILENPIKQLQKL